LHCICCDRLLSGSDGFDPPTGRYYCGECFSWTIEEQMRLASLDGMDTLGEPDDLMKAILELTEDDLYLTEIISLETFRETEGENYD
jgi:hypothetical protein